MPVATRMRQAASNVPRTIPGKRLYLDAKRPGATFSDGAPLALWTDLSGLGNDVVQATAANKPLWHATGVLFDGVDDWLSVAASLSQPVTAYIVGKHDVLTGQIFDGGIAAAAFYNVGYAEEAIYAGITLSSGVASNTISYRVLSAVFNGSSSFVGADGVGASGDAGTAAWTGFSLAARADGTQPSGASIAAVLVYSGAHDANTRKRIERYLGRQYGIALAA